MDKEYYKVQVIPFGEVDSRVNAEPRMLIQEGEEIYLTELPLSYHGEGNVKDNLFYLYNELSDNEKEMFKDRINEIHVTIPEIMKASDARRMGR